SYGMPGSPAGADDARREPRHTAGRALPRFEGGSSPRWGLYTTPPTASRGVIERRPKRVLPIDYAPPADPHDRLGEPLVESVWVEPLLDESLGGTDGGFASPEARYEQRESIELAFIAALQLLPARQRAVLVLRDVLGFSGAEVAEALETSEAA